jgi:G3E family GTPase
MMNLLIIAGFLGSGKTTFLRRIAQRFDQCFEGRKMAVIENEDGKVGIDGRFLSSTGLVVKEISSGCICCGLRVDFLTTLNDLEKEYDPDLVILEPSGVAGPRQLLQSLSSLGSKIDSVRVLTIADASRINNLLDITVPIVRDGILVCDVLVLNKTDLVSEELLVSIRSKLNAIRPSVDIVETSAKNDLNVDRLLDKIFDGDYLFSGNLEGRYISDEPDIRTDNAAVYSQRLALSRAGTDAQPVAEKAAEAVAEMAARLQKLECPMLGHIKIALSSPQNECVFISTTSFNIAPDIKGAFENEPPSVDVVINAIVYDFDEPLLEQVVCGALEKARLC